MSLRRLIEDMGESVTHSTFSRDLHTACVEHFGWGGAMYVGMAAKGSDLMPFLDLVEIVAEEAKRRRAYTVAVGGRPHKQTVLALPDFERRFNGWSDRHRFAYKLDAETIRRVGPPALADVIVGPALLASRQAGWEEAEPSRKPSSISVVVETRATTRSLPLSPPLKRR